MLLNTVTNQLLNTEIPYATGILIPLLISMAQIFQAAAPSENELDDIFTFKGLIYEQSDEDGSAGNPNVKEDVSVYEGIFFLRKYINDTNAYTVKFLGDVITAASYDEAKDKAETVSGASGYNPGRLNLELGWQWHSGDWGQAMNLSYGQEYAYKTTGYGWGGTPNFMKVQLNLNLSYRLSMI